MDEETANQKNSADEDRSVLTKKGLIDVLQHETVNKIMVGATKKELRTELLKSLSFIFATIIAVGGFYLGWASNNRENSEARLRDYTQREDQHIDQILSAKINHMQEAIRSIAELRAVRQRVVLHCRYDQPYTMAVQQVLRSDTRFKMAQAFAGFQFFFNDAVFDKYHEFFNFDEGVKDVCATDAPGDEKWHDYQEQIDALMINSIRQDEANLRKLE